MKKIRVEFRDEHSTEFAVDAPDITYLELLLLARAMPDWPYNDYTPGEKSTLEIEFFSPDNIRVNATGSINKWRLRLIADEFYLVAQSMFATQRAQDMERGE